MSIDAKVRSAASAVALLVAILFLPAACSGENGGNAGDPEDGNEPQGETTSLPTEPETTAEGPPKITLGEEPGGRPEVVLRLEGGEGTTFSGICSVGDEQSVLGGRVPKRFTFNPRGRELSCRIEKRDRGRGALKIVLVAGNTTRSIQQTNSPGSTINVTYRG
jgi:hypothetical protein